MHAAAGADLEGGHDAEDGEAADIDEHPGVVDVIVVEAHVHIRHQPCEVILTRCPQNCRRPAASMHYICQ